MATNGWYAESVSTDLQDGKVEYFVDKEGKWFNSITGIALEHTNGNETDPAVSNLDPQEFQVQGLGIVSGDVNTNVIVSNGTLYPASSSTVVVAASSLGPKSTPTTTATHTLPTSNLGVVGVLPSSTTLNIQPVYGKTVSASKFTVDSSSLADLQTKGVSTIAFSDTSIPNTPKNTVDMVVTFEEDFEPTHFTLQPELEEVLEDDYNTFFIEYNFYGNFGESANVFSFGNIEYGSDGEIYSGLVTSTPSFLKSEFATSRQISDNVIANWVVQPVDSSYTINTSVPPVVNISNAPQSIKEAFTTEVLINTTSQVNFTITLTGDLSETDREFISTTILQIDIEIETIFTR